MNIGNIFQQKIVSQTNPFGSPKSELNQAYNTQWEYTFWSTVSVRYDFT